MFQGSFLQGRHIVFSKHGVTADCITQSLAGRVGMVQLLPFSLDELLKADKLPEDFDEVMFRGLYPPLYDRDLSPGDWCAGYVNTYIERDVRQLIAVRDLPAFRCFLRMCAARSGQLLNLSSLASDCDITHNTAAAWLSVLEASYIVYLLRPHFRNCNKRLVKTPKLYFCDTGLAAWLLGIRESGQLTAADFFASLKKWSGLSGREGPEKQTDKSVPFMCIPEKSI